MAGFGQITKWEKVRELLVSAEGKKAEKVSLLIPQNESKDLAIRFIEKEQKIFHTSMEGDLEGMDAGAGKLQLRIKAERIPGMRGVCKVDAWPVYLTPKKGFINPLIPGKREDELAFSAAGFG